MIYHTYSSSETEKIGALIAEKIIKRGPLAGRATVLALIGDLGAGKTTWTRGFVGFLNPKAKVTSPTFVLMKKFSLNKSEIFKNVYHWDWYRLRDKKDLSILNFEETYEQPENLILVEWPRQIQGMLPKNVIEIFFEHGDKETERIIKIKI